MIIKTENKAKIKSKTKRQKANMNKTLCVYFNVGWNFDVWEKQFLCYNLKTCVRLIGIYPLSRLLSYHEVICRYLDTSIHHCHVVYLLYATHSIRPFRIRRATSVPLGKGTKFALHHGKMSTTKRRAIQILHIYNMFQFTFKCGYNDFISKYTDTNTLHVTQIDLLNNDTFCST